MTQNKPHVIYNGDVTNRDSEYEMDLESIMETMDIMGDPDLMAALHESIEDVRAGRFIPLEQVKSELLS